MIIIETKVQIISFETKVVDLDKYGSPFSGIKYVKSLSIICTVDLYMIILPKILNKKTRQTIFCKI